MISHRLVTHARYVKQPTRIEVKLSSKIDSEVFRMSVGEG